MQLRALVLSMLLAALLALGLSAPALALKPIVLDATQDRVEITTLGDLYESHSDSLQVETAAGADGTTDRVSVAATTAGTSPNWMVFALTNPTENAIERWITADRYTVAGSGAIWPDLDARRIENVTPTMGFAAERVKSERADVFRITIEPGQTITYVVELASDRFSRINLWKPLEYELKVRDRQLFNGIMLGLTGLLAIFLTSIFAANHKLIFPASALVAWCVLGNLCVDFGFFHKLFQLRPEDNAIYRAAAESALAASILIFTHTFLRLGTLPALIRMIITVWMVGQLSLIGLAVIDPRLAATFARLSFLVLGLAGSAVILLLALRGQDRAMSLVPPWVMFSVWLFGAAVVLTGRVSGDIAVSSLVAGLVLVLLLIGFVVTQFAFRTRDAGMTLAPTEAHLRSIAIDGAGAAVWEWNARRNGIKVSPVVEEILDLSPGQLSVKADEFITYLHPADRERFRLMLWSIQERAGGKIRTDLRLRHSDNSYRWFEIEAASVPQDEDRQVRCVGLIRDITDAKRSHERLLHDAVHDSLTGLPNRALLVDRIKTAAMRAKTDRSIRPTLFFIDIDKFKSVNTSFGLVVGDSLLLTVARRLQRHLTPQDTLARVGGDQFAILSLLDQDAQELASLAERVRRSLRSPVKMAGQDIVLTGSVGVAVFNGSDEADQDLLKDAEVAMYRAKRGGADRIEIFKPEMRSDREERLAIEAELRKAVEKNQLKFLYQPIYYLPTEELAGFETIVRWEHPKEGLINPAAIVPVDAESDLVTKLGSHVLMRAARDAAAWNKELARPDQPLFVSVNVSSRQMFRQVLVQEVRHIVGQNVVPKGALKLEIAEALVMENPEQAAEILEQLRAAGADLLLDEFGTGYSSLSYLGRLPFDTIKLQRELVQASGGRDGNGEGVVRSIVAMARELNKKVVAEGVEAEEDAAFLRSAGCEYAQGYYYGDPVPDRDVLQMLRRVRSSERRLKPRGMFRPKGKRRQDETTPTADVVPMAAAAAAPPLRNGAAGEKRPNGAASSPARPSAVAGALLPDPRPGADAEQGPRGGRLRPAAAAGSSGDAAASARTPGRTAGSGGGVPPPIPGGAARNGARPNGAGVQPMPPPARGNGPPSVPAGSSGQIGASGQNVALNGPGAGAAASNGAAANGSPNGLPAAPSPVPPTLNMPAEALPPSGLPPQQPSSPPPMPGPARQTAAPAPVDGRPAQVRAPTIPPPPGPRAVPPAAPPQAPVPPVVEAWRPQRSAPVPPPLSPGHAGPPQAGSAAGPPPGAPPPIPAAAFAPPPPPPGQAPQPRVVPPPPVVAPVVAAPKPPPAPAPDFSKLPPAIAESLARLAGIETPRKD
ncbi:MAG: EAL domain-containing protein [Hyphomicrobiaceae bacterium]|nr:EAL domain-containing protein [Hyphomicrobiaceae bacterium]